MQRIEAWMRQTSDDVWFGSGLKTGSLNSAIIARGHRFPFFTIGADGDAATVLNHCRKSPFDDPALMQQ